MASDLLIGSEKSKQPEMGAKVNNKFMRGGEHAARISYLYQAAEHVIDTSVPGLAQYYGEIMKVVAQKTPAKLDYTLKRTICKNCKILLVPGKTASYRLKRRKRGKNQKPKGYPTQVITCQACQTVKTFNTNPSKYDIYKNKEGKVKKKRLKKTKTQTKTGTPNFPE